MKTLIFSFNVTINDASCTIQDGKGMVCTEAKVKRYVKDRPDNKSARKYAAAKAISQLLDKASCPFDFSKDNFTINIK